MKKVKKAVALRYENGYNTPIVTASGMGFVAEKILETAKENNVTIIDDSTLTDLLINVEVNTAIPPDLYEAVATVIAYVMDIDRRVRR